MCVRKRECCVLARERAMVLCVREREREGAVRGDVSEREERERERVWV